MSQSVNFSVRMDSAVKKQCESLFADLGMNLTTAINVFLRQSLRYGGFPFPLRLNAGERDLSSMVPNEQSLAAMRETEDMKRHPEQYKSYVDAHEMMEELW